MFRTQPSEMRNLSATTLRPPLPKRMFVTFPFNNSAELRDRLPGEAHLVGARDYGTCSAMDQSLSVGLSAFARGDDERNPQQLSWMPRSMLVTNSDSVNCVQEHAVVRGI